MSTQTDSSTFTDIAASWEEDVPCIVEGGCERKVEWWADQHGCAKGPICDFHIKKFLESIVVDILAGIGVRCPRCEKAFYFDIEKFVHVRKI